MAPQDIVKYWKDTSDEDWKTATSLYSLENYSNALFFCHLSIEKLLKGLVYLRTNEPPLRIHNLTKLSEEAHLIIPETYASQLKEITSWNIEARYDTYKREFYTKATREFTGHWMEVAKEITLWLNKQY